MIEPAKQKAETAAVQIASDQSIDLRDKQKAPEF